MNAIKKVFLSLFSLFMLSYALTSSAIKHNRKPDLEGSWALVTGTSSGIGEEYARQLAARGMNLILVARREARLVALKKELEIKNKNTVLILSVDLLKEGVCEEVFERATEGGREIQVLVNNAGIGKYGPFTDNPLSDHIDTIELNVSVLTKLTYYFTEHMSHHGRASYITNIASLTAYQTVAAFPVYSATKSYVKDFTKALRYQYRKTNLSFTCVSPGGTYSEFMEFSG